MDISVKVITTEQQMYEVYYAIRGNTHIGIDTETTDLNPHDAKLLLISLYCPNNATSYVLDMTKLSVNHLELIRDVLEDRHIIKVGHNLIVEYKMLYKAAKIMMRGFFDTMIADSMILAGLTFINNEKLRYGLKDLAKRYLDVDLDKTIRESFIGATTLQEFSQEQLQYSGMDAVYPVMIYPLQQQRIEALQLQRISKLEMSIIPVTAIMEYTGVLVDKAKLESMVEPFDRFVFTADKALQDIFIQYGAADTILFTKDGYKTINTNSGDQVLPALQRIGIDIRDKKGKPSLDSKVIARWNMQQQKKKGKKYKDFDVDYHTLIEDEEVADALDLFIGIDNPVVRAYTFLNGARKLNSTYVHGLLKAIHPRTGRIYPSFNSYGAKATGRYSSSGPNFQNLPNDDKLKRLGLGTHSIRQCLIASPGRKFIISDYSGIELVILAILSGDKKLLEQILRGDIHTYVTQEVLGYTAINKDNKKQNPHVLWRFGAKTLSYAIAYGTTGRNVSETLNIKLASEGYKITPQEGDAHIAKWYSLFPETAKYLKQNAEQAVELGYVTDTWGRRRNWNTAEFVEKWKRLAAGREGMNAPIQSTSATMTKLAMYLIWKRLDINRARIVITVHDEIVVESTDAYVNTAVSIVKDSMEQAIRLTLPAVADDVGKYESLSANPQVSTKYDK